MEITLNVTVEEDKELRKMGIAQFGLDADCTAKDVVEFIVENNTKSRINEDLDNRFKKLSIHEKRFALDGTEPE